MCFRMLVKELFVQFSEILKSLLKQKSVCVWHLVGVNFELCVIKLNVCTLINWTDSLQVFVITDVLTAMDIKPAKKNTSHKVFLQLSTKKILQKSVSNVKTRQKLVG